MEPLSSFDPWNEQRTTTSDIIIFSFSTTGSLLPDGNNFFRRNGTNDTIMTIAAEDFHLPALSIERLL